MSLAYFAENELRIAGLFDKDSDYDGAIGPAVMKMVEVFAAEGHSGFSAGIAIDLFKKVVSFEPLTPLTGADSEWTEVSDGMFQSKRCPHVFKGADGRPYDIDAKIFREPGGACFTNSESRVYIEFPYTPTREYVDVPARALEE